jgi:hypothetical protein
MTSWVMCRTASSTRSTASPAWCTTSPANRPQPSNGNKRLTLFLPITQNCQKGALEASFLFLIVCEKILRPGAGVEGSVAYVVVVSARVDRRSVIHRVHTWQQAVVFPGRGGEQALSVRSDTGNGAGYPPLRCLILMQDGDASC